MRLSEWADQVVMTTGPEMWARQVISARVRELGADEDPVVFATYAGSTREQPLVTIGLLVALTAGLTTVKVTTDPTRSVDATVSLVIVPWSTVGPTLRLEVSGDPEESLPVVVTLVEERIEARNDRRGPLTAFFLEASRLATVAPASPFFTWAAATLRRYQRPSSSSSLAACLA
jgi:hypothetical protein